MEIKELISDGVKCVRREKRLINRMMQCEEKGQKAKFEALQPYFKALKDKTDSIIKSLIDNYPMELIMSEITTSINYDKEENLDEIALARFIDNTFHERVGEALYDLDVGVFAEENNAFLYSLYLWAMKNGDYSEDDKKNLRYFMHTRLATSTTLRYYFSGDYEAAKRVADPDSAFGTPNANMIALKAYYTLLNDLVEEANCFEMLSGLTEPSAFEAQKKQYELIFAAVCLQLQSRDIEFPVVENEISDYTQGILVNSSSLVDRFHNSPKEKGKTYEKVIYL